IYHRKPIGKRIHRRGPLVNAVYKFGKVRSERSNSKKMTIIFTILIGARSLGSERKVCG
ncbi:hypothetical protein L9F63_013642, partial [Diploptera punctata]